MSVDFGSSYVSRVSKPCRAPIAVPTSLGLMVPGKGITGRSPAVSPTFRDSLATYGVCCFGMVLTGCTGTVSMKIMDNCGSSNATIAMPMNTMCSTSQERNLWSGIGRGEHEWISSSGAQTVVAAVLLLLGIVFVAGHRLHDCIY